MTTRADELGHAIASLPPWAFVTLALGVLALIGWILWLASR